MFKVKYKDTRTTGIDKIFHYEVNEKNFLRWILRIDLLNIRKYRNLPRLIRIK